MLTLLQNPHTNPVKPKMAENIDQNNPAQAAIEENQAPDQDIPPPQVEAQVNNPNNQWYFFDWKSGHWSQINTPNNLLGTIQIELNIEENFIQN